ncbi:MAG: hypothetical protein ABEJ40_10810 [Haloarculaceae archaeon]
MTMSSLDAVSVAVECALVVVASADVSVGVSLAVSAGVADSVALPPP